MTLFEQMKGRTIADVECGCEESDDGDYEWMRIVFEGGGAVRIEAHDFEMYQAFLTGQGEDGIEGVHPIAS
jgi:hypothetical protein